jgi:hypothetical protein
MMMLCKLETGLIFDLADISTHCSFSPSLRLFSILPSQIPVANTCHWRSATTTIAAAAATTFSSQ